MVKKTFTYNEKRSLFLLGREYLLSRVTEVIFYTLKFVSYAITKLYFPSYENNSNENRVELPFSRS